jgi:hypothetical protein
VRLRGTGPERVAAAKRASAGDKEAKLRCALLTHRYGGKASFVARDALHRLCMENIASSTSLSVRLFRLNTPRAPRFLSGEIV